MTRRPWDSKAKAKIVLEGLLGKILAEYGSDVGGGYDFKYVYAGHQRIAMYN